MGSRLLSLKGPGGWGGLTRQQVNDRGQRRFLKLENCYVTADGQELRTFPGYGTFIDLNAVNNSQGYDQLVPDAVRPVVKHTQPNMTPQAFDDRPREQAVYATSQSQTLYCRAKVSSVFAFEQLGNEIFVMGESRFRESPIYNSSREQLTITNLVLLNPASTGDRIGVRLSGQTTYSTTDAGAGGNSIKVGDVVYIEELTSSDAAVQAVIDADLVGKMHEVHTVAGNQNLSFTTLQSVALASGAPQPACTGTIYRIRNNRSDNYPTVAQQPYCANLDDRPDDPEALTVWRVIDPVNMLGFSAVDPKFYDNEYPCYPAWVANRLRDFGDGNDSPFHLCTEGLLVAGDSDSPARGVSRREQRRLPYRPCVEPALDRIILAAPQYGCMFQVPARVPIDGSMWTSPTDSNFGVPTRHNYIYDKPRALGIPKPRIVANPPEVTDGSPLFLGPSPHDVSINYLRSTPTTTGNQVSPSMGAEAGEYTMAVAWYDAGTGDEGLASESVRLKMPGEAETPDGYVYSIIVNYMHPGYHMPESMPFLLNVYIAPPGKTALSYYGTFDMQADRWVAANAEARLSAHFGFKFGTPDDAQAYFSGFPLPLPAKSNDLSPMLDPQRQAPQSASMPRGSEACKYIRGVLFSGGNMGNTGADRQLWRAKASIYYDHDGHMDADDVVAIQAHNLTPGTSITSPALDGDFQNGHLGIAGRCFPDAYQGIELVEEGLLPNSSQNVRVDKVVNRMCSGRDALYNAPADADRTHYLERLQLTRSVTDRFRNPGRSPSDNLDVYRSQQDLYYVMPRGQLQIGDPGAPHRSNKAFIKIVDPKRGGDIKAIGQLGGSAIVCTQNETYSYSWYRNVGSDEPNLLSEQFGCIGSNTMVEFDGGLAWLSNRGPVALGASLQHVGADIAESFYRPFLNESSEYIRDSQGMMRHSWGVHDEQRGLVMWGLLTRDATTSIEWEGVTTTFDADADLTDEQISRFPCNEVLIWSYRANAFSTWRPPAGLGIYWMRPLRDGEGVVRMCFLAEDKVIYALDDEWGDANGVFGTSLDVTAASASDGASTTFTFSSANGTFKDGDTATYKKNFATYLRAGMLVEFLDSNGNVSSSTTIASITTTSQSAASVVELTAAQTWASGQTVRLGARARTTITTTYVGAETMDTLQVQRVQMRYGIEGTGHANAKVRMFKSETGVGTGEEALSIDFTEPGTHEAIGAAKPNTSVPSEIAKVGRRRNFSRGQISGAEVAVQVELTGQAQVRIQDISLEVG